MKLKPTIFIVLHIFLWWLSPHPILAVSADFQTTVDSTYTVNPDGTAAVNQNYSITNLSASVYPTDYEISLDTETVSKIEAHTLGGSVIPYTIEKNDANSFLKLVFPEKNVGKGKSLQFNLNYQTGGLASKKGTALEIAIPKVDPNANLITRKIDLMIPIEYGAPVSISPSPDSQQTDPLYTRLTFSSDQFRDKGVLALFGDKQIYDVNLIYHLENSNITPVETQIALPPDTDYQRIFLDKIDPPPAKLHLDEDGNWIATYLLKSQTSFPIYYHSQVIVYSQPLKSRNLSEKNLHQFIEEKNFWPVNHPLIQTKAHELNTPQSIYQYVVNTLSYNYNRAESKNPERLGATKALANPVDSLCLEYADLFISLSRAAGIPSKLITGYGYSDNFQKKPTAASGSIFHAWASYLDPQTNIWREVDPTWGHTTGGNDYFNQIGFNHLTFTVNGLDSQRPYPPGAYQKDGANDLKIDLTDKFPQKTINITGRLTPSLLFNLGLTDTLNLELENHGSVAVYNFPVDLSATGRTLISNSSPKVPALLPYDSTSIPIRFKRSLSFKPFILNSLIYGNSQNYLSPGFIAPSYLKFVLAGVFILAAACIFIFFLSRHLLVSKR